MAEQVMMDTVYSIHEQHHLLHAISSEITSELQKLGSKQRSSPTIFGISTVTTIIIIMDVSVAHYPMPSLGHNALFKTMQQKRPWSLSAWGVVRAEAMLQQPRQ